MKLYTLIARLWPPMLRRKIGELLYYAGFVQTVEQWVTRVTVSAVIFSSVLTLLTYRFIPFLKHHPFLLFILLFFSGFLVPYSFLVLVVDRRTKEMEKLLPDALRLMASNVRAGMTPERALWLTIRPEFGTLSEELRRASAETLAGKSFDEALENMAKKSRSGLVKRTLMLIVEGARSGGELAELLERTAGGLREREAIFKEISSTLRMYVLFIIFASVIAAPLLFGIATFFVNLNTKLYGLMGEEALQRAGMVTTGFITIKLGGIGLPYEELLFIMSLSLLIIASGASLIVGEVAYGKLWRGLRLVPVFASLSILIYFLTVTLASNVFFGMMGLA